MLTPKQVFFDPRTKTMSILTPEQKNMSISVFTLKPSQSVSPAQNQVNLYPNSEVKSISVPILKTKSILYAPRHENQVNFDANTKPCRFRAVTLRVIHTSTCSYDTAAIRII